MPEVAILVLLLHVGEPLRFEVPWTICLAEFRRWRYVDATGGRIVAFDTDRGAKVYVREVRCELSNETGPIS